MCLRRPPIDYYVVALCTIRPTEFRTPENVVGSYTPTPRATPVRLCLIRSVLIPRLCAPRAPLSPLFSSNAGPDCHLHGARAWVQGRRCVAATLQLHVWGPRFRASPRTRFPEKHKRAHIALAFPRRGGVTGANFSTSPGICVRLAACVLCGAAPTGALLKAATET